MTTENLQKLLSVLQRVAKFVVALIAAVTVLISVLPEGVTANEWVAVGAAFLGALGVYQVRNK